MSAKLTAGVRQQAPLGNRGSIEAWCQIEVELPEADKIESEAVLSQARQIYAACSQAVEEQLCWRDGSSWRRNGRG
jgi:hypothetical protein